MPSTIEETLEHVMFLARHLNHCDYSCVVIIILYELGFAPKKDGFYYLQRSIGMRYENPTRQFKGDIYSEVAGLIDGGSNDEQIEQAIRSAIEQAWKVGDEKVWSIFFPRNLKGKIPKPSNADFIARIASFIEMWRGCCKGVAHAER